MLDKLYKPSQVLGLIGVSHVSEVYREIQAGRLRAKHRVCRGSGEHPRILIPESAIKEYVDALPDVTPKESVPAAAKDEKPRRRTKYRPAESEEVTQYYP